ncbi:MAG: topoisomerase DNA-binding C4 zinc finger domain-containing protein [Clostridia bacterium]|nr:topoisomerase DNA-binding C4 zinc finger domain-containing protein [Clostridia bacterium]
MERLILPLILLLIGASAAVFVTFREKKLNTVVEASSEKIDQLKMLNERIGFLNIQPEFYVYKVYDNKSNFNRIDPAYLMAAELRNNIGFFTMYFEQLQQNRNTLQQYEAKTQEILAGYSAVDYEKLKIKESEYKRREEKLLNKHRIIPVTNCAFHVVMNYSSPKGRVQLTKNGLYGPDDMFACLESVSRSHLDKSTYNGLAAVERGEVSDSLRYDILRRDNFTCVLCGASARQGARLHVDHIVPIAKGGKSVPSNLRTLCERCNIGKLDKIETVSETKTAMDHTPDDLVCSWCGGKLVLRKGKYGDFYGCSNFPTCKFTKKLP